MKDADLSLGLKSILRFAFYTMEPRLLPHSSSIPSQITTGDDSPRSKEKGRESFEGPSALVDRYELVGAVPTRILKPSSAESNFTCYAFCTEGHRFITGESDGTIKLWTTLSYELVGSYNGGSISPVSALSFYGKSSSTLVTVDKVGVVRLIRFEPQGTADATTSRTAAAVLNVKRIVSEEEESTHAGFLRDQFSADGRILAHFRGDHDQVTEAFALATAHIYRIGNDLKEFTHTQISPSDDRFEFSVPVLSKNGRSLLICSCRRDEEMNSNGLIQETYLTSIDVIPRIDHQAQRQALVNLDGEHACWGLGGEYLLLWGRSKNERPRLMIYRTEDLNKKGRRAKPFAQKKLDLGLFDYKAQVLENEAGDTSVKVLIYEITEHEKKRMRRFFIWNTKEDTVSSEVQMNMYQVKAFNRMQYTLGSKTADRLVESGSSSRSAEAFYCRLVTDVYPKFCASKDKRWIGGFSWKHHSGGILSTDNGVTTWRFRLPESVTLDPFTLPNHVLFEPREHHFLLFADSVIFVCNPDFLHPSNASPVTGTVVQRAVNLTSLSETDDRDLLERWNVVPNALLVKRENIKLKAWSRKTTLLKREQVDKVFEKIIDAFQSEDGAKTGVIVEDTNSARPTIVSIAETGQELDLGTGNHLRFPAQFPLFNEPFTPARIFLYGRRNRGKGRIALLSDQQKPFMVFCDDGLRLMISANLEMTKWLDVCMTEDRKQLLILDTNAVCILNLKQRKIVSRIEYKVDFEAIADPLADNMHWSRRGGEGEEDARTERRISDRGTAVLLGWDARNQRSITVTPEMEQEDCEVLIQRAEKKLSDYCTLSASGTSTSFLEAEDLAHGKITVGVFNERAKKVVLHFHVAENVPISLSEAAKISVLSNVFYGVSKDERELVTVTAGLSQLLPQRFEIEDKVRVFNIYGADDCIPTYERITLKRIDSIERTFQKLHDEHGVSAFSAPAADGMTIFQKAFLAENKEVVECIKKFAAKHECLLAVEWTSPGSESNAHHDLLSAALKKMSPALVKEAVWIVCSPLVPFGSAAKVLNEHFRELVLHHLDVLQEALEKNLLVAHVCDLDVHVKFMDQKCRKQSAVHIGASDTFLDWKHIKDKNALKENWRHKNKAVVKNMEAQGNISTTEASLKFVRIENAAKTGMNGILRPILLANVPETFFEFDVVKWVVLFKWFAIWRKKFLTGFAVHVAFLTFFSAYAVTLAKTESISDAERPKKIYMSVFLALSLPFCGNMVIEECRQLKTYMKDGMQRDYHATQAGRNASGFKRAGVRYYLGLGWNMIDVLSCVLLLGCIAPLHVIAFFHKEVEDALSALVAIESIVVFAKVWYFAQPFQFTGPLVRMIYMIVWDSSVFLALAFIVMFGFAVGLPTLFRNYNSPKETDDDEDEDYETVHNAFGRFRYSLRTLFFALVGNFNSEVFHVAGNLSELAVLIFVLYLLAQMILLLNLLISIMSDTFARVKGTQEAHLLMGRAQFIDACEAGLTPSERKAMDDGIERYLHALMDVGAKFDREAPIDWIGKLDAMEEKCKAVVRSSENNVKAVIVSQGGAMSDAREQLEELQRMLKSGPSDRVAAHHSVQRMEEVENRLSVMENTLERTSNRIDEVLELIKNMTRTQSA